MVQTSSTILHGQLIYYVFLADVWFGTYICDGEDERESEGLSFVLYFIVVVVVVQLKAINEIGQDLFNICNLSSKFSNIINHIIFDIREHHTIIEHLLVAFMT